MSIKTFNMPDVGEGLTEAEVLSWHVAVGDDITVNQIFVEIETAKAAVELPSPFAGKVTALLVEPGVTVDVGTPIISVDTAPGAGVGAAAGSSSSVESPATGGPVGPAESVATAEPVGTKIGEVGADGRIATLVGFVSPGAGTTRRARRSASVESVESVTPAGQAGQATNGIAAAPSSGGVELAAAPSSGGVERVAALSSGAVERLAAPSTVVAAPGAPAPKAAPPTRKLARDLGVDLASLVPARADGVVTRSEVEQAARRVVLEAESPAGHVNGAAPSGGQSGLREHRIPVRGVRKATAQAMVTSAFTAPHVTEFLTIDITATMELRDRLRRRPEFAEVRLTPLAFVARALCLAVKRTPEINAVWDGDAGDIVVKDYINLGIAAATPRGLLVPNIPDADQLSLRELATALGELTDTARAGRTSPAAMAHGTITITNVGIFGIDTGTPIINPGESAILAVGAIKDAPWVVDGQLAVRKVCQLAVSFDHRVIDGLQGSAFLADLGALLTDPGLALAF